MCIRDSTCIGSILVYLLLCKIGKRRFEKIKRKYALVNQAAGWVHAKGGKALFILLCFPFTPSIAVAILGAIGEIPKRTYIKAVVFGKSIMIFILSVFGYNIQVALSYPSRLILIAIVGTLGYLVSKKILNKYQSMHQYDAKRSA